MTRQSKKIFFKKKGKVRQTNLNSRACTVHTNRETGKGATGTGTQRIEGVALASYIGW